MRSASAPHRQAARPLIAAVCLWTMPLVLRLRLCASAQCMSPSLDHALLLGGGPLFCTTFLHPHVVPRGLRGPICAGQIPKQGWRASFTARDLSDLLVHICSDGLSLFEHFDLFRCADRRSIFTSPSRHSRGLDKLTGAVCRMRLVTCCRVRLKKKLHPPFAANGYPLQATTGSASCMSSVGLVTI